MMVNKISRASLIKRFGEPDFEYSRTIYWYDQMIRVYACGLTGYQIQFIKYNKKYGFMFYNNNARRWHQIGIQKLVKQDYQEYIIEQILLGKE